MLDVPGRPRVLHTPGHTPGHSTVLFADPGVVLAGHGDPWHDTPARAVARAKAAAT